MKKLFVLAASAMMVFASCTDNEIVYQNETPQEIGLFSVVDNMTRAAQTAEGGFRHSNMKVAAYLVANSSVGVENGGDYFDDATFSGTPATASASAGNFIGGKYWPIQNATLNFLAVAPSDDDVVTEFGSLPEDAEEDDPKTNFAGTATVNVTNIDENQHDVMYAKGTGAKNAGVVSMVFQHALAWVNFTFQAGMEGITIKKVTVYGANYNGTLTVTQENYDKATGQSVGASWSGESGMTTDGKEVPFVGLTADGVVLVKNAATATTWGEGLLVVPSEPTKFVIDYTVAYESGAYDYKYTYTLNDEDVEGVETSWEQGKKYTYNITMNFANEIQIAPTVTEWADWTDANGNGEKETSEENVITVPIQ